VASNLASNLASICNEQPSNSIPPAFPQEYVNGQLKNKYGDAFIRGNNGEDVLKIASRALSICPAAADMTGSIVTTALGYL
jgi:hypothetical protein